METKITNIYYSVYVPVNKVELEQIVNGHVGTCDRYDIRYRSEMLSLAKEGHELENNVYFCLLTELKEAKGVPLKPKKKLETQEWTGFIDKQSEERREYREENPNGNKTANEIRNDHRKSCWEIRGQKETIFAILIGSDAASGKTAELLGTKHTTQSLT